MNGRWNIVCRQASTISNAALSRLWKTIIISPKTGCVYKVHENVECNPSQKKKLLHASQKYPRRVIPSQAVIVLSCGNKMCSMRLPGPRLMSSFTCVYHVSLLVSKSDKYLFSDLFCFHRYVAICKPFRSHTTSKLSRAVRYILAIWMIAMCLAVPQVSALSDS